MQAVPMPIIYSTPSGLQVRGRRCLERMAFEDVLEDLQKHLTEELNRGGGSPVIQDLDLAQNMLSLEQFENLFFSLGVASAHVVRFRLFGCPTLDDEAMRIFAEYLRTSENAPAEMHLSDCAITTEGFQHLMSAIEETDLYPLVNANVPGEGLPLYLRLENNYIGQEAIQEKIDAGLIQTFDKQQGRRTGHQSGPKVNLLAKDTHFRQKQGPPPTPEAARPPKFVNDRNAARPPKFVNDRNAARPPKFVNDRNAARPPKFVNDRNAARPPKFVNDRNEGHSESHVPRGCCQASPSQPIAVPQHSHHQDGPPSAFLATPDRPRPIAHITISKTLQPRPKTAQPRPPPKALQPQPKARPPQPKARPPQPKAMPSAQTLPPDMDGKQPSGSKCVVQPSKRRNRDSQPPSVDSKAKKPRGSVGEMLQLGGNKPSKKPTPQSRLDNPVAERTERMPKLPYPWQEHFDEQRGVSYFWNAKTGDSVWERPTS